MEGKKIFNDIKMLYADVSEDFGSKVWKITLVLSKWKKDSRKYVDEIRNKVLKGFKRFPVSTDSDTSEAFCRYVCKSVSRRIHTLQKLESLKAKNGGITISEYTLKKNSKLKDVLNRINPDLKGEDFWEEVTKGLGVKKKTTAIRHLNIMTAGRIDIDNVQLKDKAPSPEKEWSSREEQIETLRKIEAAWKKKPRKKESDRMLSELLTVWVLDMFNKMEKDDLDYDFIDRTILNDYFAQKNYRFPEAQEIAKKYGYTDKSAATQNLKRFGEKIGIEFKYPRQPKKS